MIQRDEEEKGRKWLESKQDAESHTQETEPSQQHRPTQNTPEVEVAAQAHEPTRTERRNNYPPHNPEQARPLATDTRRKPANGCETSRTEVLCCETKTDHAIEDPI
jgi:hypothetical protein